MGDIDTGKEFKKAVNELSISIACLLDAPTEVTQEDLEHIQNQITIIERGKDVI